VRQGDKFLKRINNYESAAVSEGSSWMGVSGKHGEVSRPGRASGETNKRRTDFGADVRDLG